MTFDAREKSRHDAEPVECYRFTLGAESWLLTSADEVVTLPAGTFTPAPIIRGELDASQESEAGSLEVTLPATHAIAQLHVAFVPTTLLTLVLYRAHRGEESAAAVWFVGTVASARFHGAQATLACRPLEAALRRQIPVLRFQSQCNWALYGDGCGVDRNAFRDVAAVSAVAGATVTSPAFDLRADGWFTNGWLEASGGERRFVVDHVGDTVTLMHAFTALVPGDVVHAFAGCDRTEATCAARFANLANHLGFPRIPTRNPHGTGVA